jgi:hypothetical protein
VTAAPQASDSPPNESVLTTPELRQIWHQALEGNTSSLGVEDVFDRLEQKYQSSESEPTMSAATLNPYAKFLQGQAPLTVLDETHNRLHNLAHAIGPSRLNQSPAPGKWSPRDIFCHLADCETVFAFRLRQTLSEDHHVIQPFDQDKWAATYASVPATDALVTFAALRHWNLLLIESALPQHANKPVTHPERGAMTFATIVETMAGHDLNHIAQLERIAGE